MDDTKKQKHRSWVATIFCQALAHQDVEWIKEIFNMLGAEWAIGQLEECPTTERLHWQCTTRFKSPRSFRSVRSGLAALGCGFHIEPCKALKASIAYCQKDSTALLVSRGPAAAMAPLRFEIGERPAQGNRSELEAATDLIMSGKSIREVALAMPKAFVRNFRGLGALQALVMKARKGVVSTWVHFGMTGAGKTHAAVKWCEENDLEYAIVPNPASRSHVAWMDPVTPDTKVIIFDDFDPNMWSDTHILSVCDEYGVSFRTNTLGTVPGQHTHVFFTCRRHPIHWGWENAGKQLDAFMRRVNANGGIRQFDPRLGPVGSYIVCEERVGGDALVYPPDGIFPRKAGGLVAETQEESQDSACVRPEAKVIVLDSDEDEAEEQEPQPEATDDPIIWTPPKRCVFHVPKLYPSDDDIEEFSD
jgi:hypothetical protein